VFSALHPEELGKGGSERADSSLITVTLGYKSTLKTLRSGKAKLVIIAGNTPPLRKSELECKPSNSAFCLGNVDKLQIIPCYRKPTFTTSLATT